MQQNKDGEQKSLKQFGLFSIVLFVSFNLYGASFEDFKKSQVESFNQYVDERDSEFKNYLDQQFKEYKEFISEPLYEKPKPKKITTTKAEPIKSVGPKVNVKVKELPKKIVKKIKSIPIEVHNKKDIEFDFFGSQVGFNYNKNIKKAKFYPQTQKGIGNFFKVIASSEHSYLVDDIRKIAQEMMLNDWGIYQLVNKISQHIFLNKDDQELLSWFLFNKLGYDVRVGLASKHIVLMHYSKKVIYSTPNYKFGTKKFYVVSYYAKGGVGNLYSYEQSYPDALKPLDLSLKQLPNFQYNIKSKTLVFKQFGKKYQFHYKYNQNLIDFMATYPQADYETYFNAPLDPLTYSSLSKELKKYVDGKQASSAINFVLNFVQNAFDYQVDHAQFGREKVMFANETLYFNKSDCEDRAILFSYLIKNMFKIGVIGVKYKDHMATALYIPMNGDTVKAKGKKFVIADPTYINANIGQSMPKYRSIIPNKFIVVR